MLKFEMDDIEQKEAQEFMDSHHITCKSPYYSYIFTPTGIGIGIKIVCTKCGKDKDITNYSNW